MSRKNGRVPGKVHMGKVDPSFEGPFPAATQARLDRAGERVRLAQQQLQTIQQQGQVAQNVYNQEFGRLRGVLEAALEEAGLPLETEAQYLEGHVRLASSNVAQPLEMVPEKSTRKVTEK